MPLGVQAKKRIAREVLPKMIEAHPKAFFPSDSTDTVPLVMGVKHQLVALHPEIPAWKFGLFLGAYVSKTRYVRALATSACRYDLDGNAATEISDDHRLHAIGLLAERQAALIDKQKAKAK